MTKKKDELVTWLLEKFKFGLRHGSFLETFGSTFFLRGLFFRMNETDFTSCTDDNIYDNIII